jgi:hypothetical protein
MKIILEKLVQCDLMELLVVGPTENLLRPLCKVNLAVTCTDFRWLDDERIGELPIEWNWLPDEFGVNPEAKLLHYTLGNTLLC